MPDKSDHVIDDIIHFFSARGVEAGYLVPTRDELEMSTMHVPDQLVRFFRSMSLHDFSLQAQGSGSAVSFKTWFVYEDRLEETETSLERPLNKKGDPSIRISSIDEYAVSGSILILLVLNKEIYIANASNQRLWESFGLPSSRLGNVIDFLMSGKQKPLEDRFAEWNMRLLRCFFTRASAGEEVFLRVDKDFLDEIGQDIGGDEGFLQAVRHGPAWIDSRNNFTRRILILKYLRTVKKPWAYKDPGDFDCVYRGAQSPAYLPYLAALVRNYSEHSEAYYKGLSSDFQLSDGFDSNDMESLTEVWEDLQTWTHDRNGEFGLFTYRVLGGYRRIGVPRSQIILSKSDIQSLPRLFVQAEIMPGQLFGEEYCRRTIVEAKSSKALFSSGFQQAIEIEDFKQPILDAISSYYSDWDGTLPERKAISRDSRNLWSKSSNIGVTLVVTNEDPLELSPRWQVPALHDSGSFKLLHGNDEWIGNMSGLDAALTSKSDISDSSFWEVLCLATNSERKDVPLKVEYCGSADSESELVQIGLAWHALWILVPFINPITGCFEIRESDFPASGCVYLLAPPSNVDNVNSYLSRNNPNHSLIHAAGIPDDWLLVCLLDCSALTQDQRTLPDGHYAHPKPRAIRFIDGRSIQRGYSRMYLPYDLPVIELDAPEGSRIECTGGLKLTMQSHQHSSKFLTPLKRFNVSIDRFTSGSYDLEVFDPNGLQIGRAKLRVAGTSGEGVEKGKPFSLDKFGNPLGTTEGLSGALLKSSAAEGETYDYINDRFDLQPAEIGRPIEDRQSLDVNVSALFLDALAQAGSFDYGTARDLLRRLLQNANISADPTLIILDLRRRGHLEIATTYKGHIARIHSVAPTLYSVALSCTRKPVWGVAGTLRLSHWEALMRPADSWEVRIHEAPFCSLPSCRLIITDEGQAKNRAEHSGFQYISAPSYSISRWLGTLESFKEEIFHNTMESIGKAREGAQRFHASRGLFTATPNGQAQTVELWKVQDLDTKVDRLYLLTKEGKYAFVRDSRWGVWLALAECAKWLSLLPGMDDVYPLPLTYVAATGTIWLPARLSIPSVLERALILSSGSAPSVTSMNRNFDQTSTDGNGRIVISAVTYPRNSVLVSSFYSEMAEGRWISYPHVHEEVAKEVASKLSAVLDFI